MRTRIAIGGLVAAAIAGAVLLGGVLAGSRETASARSISPNLFGDFSAGKTTSLVLQLQSKLRARPDDAKTNALLGLAYQQRARETGDPSYYAKSDGVLRRALRTEPTNLLATSALGSLELSRHRFREALVLGRRAVALSPSTARSYGVVGDALVELGRYDEAFAAFDHMAALRPSLSAYARISYARELLGDFAGAAQAMRLALDAAVAQPEALAWTHVQLGKLFWNIGRIRAAAREYRAALAVFPGYVYAYDQLAQTEAARGNFQRAIEFERRAVETIPLPQFVTVLGDLYAVTGDSQKSRNQYATIDVIRRLLTANGVKTDLETALFYVDHGVRLPRALSLARSAYRDRPSLDGNDVLAWALMRTGNCEEALGYSRRALRLGTRDASKFFHRAMIERCLGRSTAARIWFRRALELNPRFSLLWAPVARRLLR